MRTCKNGPRGAHAVGVEVKRHGPHFWNRPPKSVGNDNAGSPLSPALPKVILRLSQRPAAWSPVTTPLPELRESVLEFPLRIHGSSKFDSLGPNLQTAREPFADCHKQHEKTRIAEVFMAALLMISCTVRGHEIRELCLVPEAGLQLFHCLVLTILPDECLRLHECVRS